MKIKKITTKPKNKARENECKPKIKKLLSNVNVGTSTLEMRYV